MPRFLRELVGLEMAAGIALGLDRLFMLLMGSAEVEEVMCLTSRDLGYDPAGRQ